VPDPTHQPEVILPAQLEVAVEDWIGAWAHVRTANGWQGWVDGRLLISRR
jgi:SH3-like domain-containing protein